MSRPVGLPLPPVATLSCGSEPASVAASDGATLPASEGDGDAARAARAEETEELRLRIEVRVDAVRLGASTGKERLAASLTILASPSSTVSPGSGSQHLSGGGAEKVAVGAV